MTTNAQYASIPKIGKVKISTANPNRDGTGAMGVLYTGAPAYQSGSRLDKLQVQALGDTTTGMLRLFLVKGAPGMPISSITFSGTTATVTTTGNHNLVTGDLVTLQNVMPDLYNQVNTAITVTGPAVFTFVLPSIPTTNATTAGAFSYIKAAEVPDLWREIGVTAATVAARALASITFSTTTATATTATAHGLSTGDTIVVTGATPAQYNGTFTITVTSSTTFTYVMATAPATNASVVGAYSVVKAAFSRAMYSQNQADAGYFPLVLPAGWQIRVATNNAESFVVSATFTGDLA